MKSKRRSFSVELPGGGRAMVHGDPNMSAKSRAALDEVLAAALEQLKTIEGQAALEKLVEKSKWERLAEASKPKTVKKLPEWP